MCYSSKVSQNIKDLARQFSATMDYSEVERLLMERLGGHPIRLARGFEWNFSNPQTPQERRIKDLDASTAPGKSQSSSRIYSSRRNGWPTRNAS